MDLNSGGVNQYQLYHLPRESDANSTAANPRNLRGVNECESYVRPYPPGLGIPSNMYVKGATSFAHRNRKGEEYNRPKDLSTNDNPANLFTPSRMGKRDNGVDKRRNNGGSVRNPIRHLMYRPCVPRSILSQRPIPTTTRK